MLRVERINTLFSNSEILAFEPLYDLLEHGNYEQAITILLQMLNQKPDSFATHFLLAEAFVMNEQFQEAIGEAKIAVTLSKDKSFSYETLGDIYVISRQPINALRAYANAIRYAPAQPEPYISFVRCLFFETLNFVVHLFVQ